MIKTYTCQSGDMFRIEKIIENHFKTKTLSLITGLFICKLIFEW